MTIPINPSLPDGFWSVTWSEMTGDLRPWWGQVFIRETRSDQIRGGVAFSVYRFDRCGVPGPTRHGTFLDLPSARALAQQIGRAASPGITFC